MSKVIKLVDINVVVFGGSAGNKIPCQVVLRNCCRCAAHILSIGVDDSKRRSKFYLFSCANNHDNEVNMTAES